MARAAVARAAALAGGTADRYPSGKLKPTHPPATIKRIVESALMRGENPLLGTPIGWLHLHGELTAKQLSAGVEYARLRSSYDRAMGLPRRSARNLGFEDNPGHWTEEDVRAVRHQFETLRDKLVALGRDGVKIVSILDDSCVDLQMPSWPQQIMLRVGLDKVAEHFRLDTKRAA